ncbi:unnamed protein product [Prunus armeniaca]
MHVEKNVFDTLVGTILDIEGKTKDTVEARLDLERMGIRRGLLMNRDSDKAGRDLEFFFPIKPNDKKESLKFVSSVKFLNGYASNIACCVNVDGGKFIGLKSHDCHVFMRRLLPVGIQHLLPEDVVKPIIFLHKYDPRDGSLARRNIVCWSYQLALDVFNRKASRRAEKKCMQQGEARMINYRGLDVEMAFNRPQRNNDGGMRNEKLFVFAQSARPFGDPGRGESFSRNDMDVAHWFVLNNCDEIMAYLDEHEEMMKREHPSHLCANKHCELFPQWFLDYLKSSNSPIYSDELYNLAFGPIRAELFLGCHINGVKFLGTARDDKLCTQNSGVHVPGGGESTDIDFYGKLTTVVQLLYKDRYQVIMFKCRWFDTNPNRLGSVKIDHGLLAVNINRTWYDDDPYILANMATQIVYLDDPKAGSGWKVVQKMDHRNVYAIPELDPTDNDVDNVANQH